MTSATRLIKDCRGFYQEGKRGDDKQETEDRRQKTEDRRQETGDRIKENL
jgi:hypothetical protein